jgi:hypothetical protein
MSKQTVASAPSPVKSPPPGRTRRRQPILNVCPGCGSDRLDLGNGSGPHVASVTCKDCGRLVRWVGLPIDRAEAKVFVMPFGKHRGEAMGGLPRSYLRWLAEKVDGRIGERAGVLLEGGQP